MDEATLKLTAAECKMLLGMIEWSWTEGGVRSEHQAMLILTIKSKIIAEMDAKSKKREMKPEEGKVDAPA